MIKVPPEPPTTSGILQRTPKPTLPGVDRRTGFANFTDQPTSYFGQVATTTPTTSSVIGNGTYCDFSVKACMGNLTIVVLLVVRMECSFTKLY